jgi:hypothetical protein
MDARRLDDNDHAITTGTAATDPLRDCETRRSMNEHNGGARITSLIAMTLAVGVLWTVPAMAADPPPEASGDAPPPAEAAPPAAPPMAPPPAAAAPSAVEATPKPPTAAEAMPASRPDALPPIDVGAWVRAGATIQGQDPSKLNDWHMSDAYAEIHAGGKIHKNVGLTVNFNASMANYATPGMGGAPPNQAFVALEDAIIQFDFMDEFHVWGGHLLVPVDRANSAGPFFAIPWNFLPGLFALPALPKEGPTGRNNGAVVWGDIAKGKVTYLVGVFDNGDIGTHPLYSGRVRLSLLDEEPGFWGNASYFGDHDIASIGIGGQYQKSGSTAGDKNWTEFNADALVEKKLGGGSFVTGELGYYHFGDDDLAASDLVYVLGSFATGTVGYGNLQPHARFQYEKIKANTGTNPWNLDVGVGYLIKGPALRVVGTYSYSKLGSDTKANAILLSAQAIFF